MRLHVGIAGLMLGGLAACTVPAAAPEGGAAASEQDAAASKPDAAGAEPGAAVRWRVLVKLQEASADPLVLAREASAIAGVPVRYAAAASPRWHALTLHCASSADCEAALQRLRSDHRAFAEVERETLKRAGS